MTRFATIGGLVLVLSLPAFAEDKKGLQPFQGSWKVVAASQGGAPAPKEVLERLSFAFEGEKMVVTEGGKADAGSFAVDPMKDPAEIDMVSPKGDKIVGIYKFDKDGKLTLAFVKKKDAARPKGFDDKEASLLVLEKVEQPKK